MQQKQTGQKTIHASRAGFTLVEVIVTLILVVLVIAVSATFLTSGANFLSRTERTAKDKVLAQAGADFVKERLLYASEVKVVEASAPPPASVSSGFDVLYIGNGDGTRIEHAGKLYYKAASEAAPVDILGDIYAGRELALAYAATVLEGPGVSPDITAEKVATFEIEATVVAGPRQTQAAKQLFRMYNIDQTKEPKANIKIASWQAADPSKNKRYYLLISPATN
jgi:prepilin-type N-terminal cleavage/methylation domain-containing protein